jgi:hypothetical protein
MPSFVACCGPKADEEEKRQRKQNKKIEDELNKDRRKYKATQRLLLLGTFHFVINWLNQN